MNSNYKDNLGLWHDRDTSNGYVSGNTVLYSAYADKLGLPINLNELDKLAVVNYRSGLITTYRYQKNYKPDSIDNAIGFIHFNILNADDYERNDWYFSGNYTMYFWKLCIKQLFIVWKESKNLTGSDKRNYWWEHRYEAVGKLSMMLTPQYRYYAKKYIRAKTTMLESIAFHSHILLTALGDDNSAKNICVLMLEDLNSKWLIKLFDKKKQYAEYFPEDHPIVKGLYEQ